MAKTEHYFTKFEAGRYYHIYNRGIDRKAIFKQNENYEFFLTRIEKYLSPVLDLYAYCLLKNHFHLLVRIKDMPCFTELSNTTEPDITNTISHSFQKMFQSYAMAYNKQYDRVGSLFQKPFKRNLVDSEDYYTKLILYIHANPQKHSYVKDFRTYQWSSYLPILKNKSDILHSAEVIDWFGGKDQYLELHADRHKNNIFSELDDDLSLESFSI